MISRHPIQHKPMAIKYFFLILSFFCGAIQIQAQQTVQFTYDLSGNRIKKEIILSTVRSSEVESLTLIDNTFEEKVIIYPNPTKGLLKVQFSDFEEKYVGQAWIHNLSGKTIEKQTIKNGFIEFDLSSYPVGIYILALEINKKRSTWKIIKE